MVGHHAFDARVRARRAHSVRKPRPRPRPRAAPIARPDGADVDPVEAPGIVGERRVAARAHVVDDRGDHGVDFGRGLRAWRRAASTNRRSKSADRMSSVIAIRSLRRRCFRPPTRSKARGRDKPAPVRRSPMSRSSASTHSTSRRTSDPSAKARMIMPAGGSVFSNVTARRLSTASLSRVVRAEMRRLSARGQNAERSPTRSAGPVFAPTQS